MGFEGLADLMRSRCLSQETPKPRFATAERYPSSLTFRRFRPNGREDL